MRYDVVVTVEKVGNKKDAMWMKNRLRLDVARYLRLSPNTKIVKSKIVERND